MNKLVLLPLLLLPLLGGCASLNGDSAMTDAECRQKAENDPAVQLMIVKMAGNDRYRPLPGEPSLADLKHQVYVSCLRTKGLAPKGGVEPVRRNWY